MQTLLRTVLPDWLRAQAKVSELDCIGLDEARRPAGQRFNEKQRADYRNAVQYFEDVRLLCGQTLALYLPAANDAVVAEPAEAP